MERIVSQGPSLSSKKMAKDYQDSIKYKKMKDRQMGISVEKLIQRKKKMVQEAKSHVLPIIQSSKNQSPQAPPIEQQRAETEEPRNDGSLSSSLKDKRAQEAINIAHTQYNNNNTNYRYTLPQKIEPYKNVTGTPISQRQTRAISKSMMNDYKDTEINANLKSNKNSIQNLNKNNMNTIQVKSKPPIRPQINNNSKLSTIQVKNSDKPPQNQKLNTIDVVKSKEDINKVKPSLLNPILKNKELTNLQDQKQVNQNKQVISTFDDEPVIGEQSQESLKPLLQQQVNNESQEDQDIDDEYELDFAQSHRQQKTTQRDNQDINQSQINQSLNQQQTQKLENNIKQQEPNAPQKQDNSFYERNSIVSEQMEEEQQNQNADEYEEDFIEDEIYDEQQ